MLVMITFKRKKGKNKKCDSEVTTQLPSGNDGHASSNKQCSPEEKAIPFRGEQQQMQPYRRGQCSPAQKRHRTQADQVRASMRNLLLEQSVCLPPCQLRPGNASLIPEPRHLQLDSRIETFQYLSQRKGVLSN